MKKKINHPDTFYFIVICFLGCALFLVFSGIIYKNYHKERRLNDSTFKNYEISRASRKIFVNLIDMETGVQGYLLTGDQTFLKPYQAATKILPENIENLDNLIKNDHIKRKNAALWLEEAVAFQDSLSKQVKNYPAFKKENALDSSLEKQKLQMDDIRTVFENRIVISAKALQDRMNLIHDNRRNFLFILIFSSLFAVTAMIAATYIIIKLMAKSKAVSSELLRTEERFRIALNGIGDGVYDYNPNNRAVVFSQGSRDLLGYNLYEFPNDIVAFNELLHPDDLDPTWEAFSVYQREKTPVFKFEFRMRHLDGSWRWILSRGIGFWDEKGEMTRIVGTQTDITDQKMREEQLKQANEDLETFTFIASHDLRSPLVNMKGFSQELKYAITNLKPVIDRIKETLSPEDQKILHESFEQDIPEAIRFIEQSTDRMDLLTTAVLDLSRIGKREYVFKPTDMNVIMQRCIDAQQFEIKRLGIKLSVHPLPEIVIDPLALEQVICNLLDNAVKYIAPDRPGEITIDAIDYPADVVLRIQDNGRGIAPEDQSKIFEMFKRARNSGEVRGAGMGMSFVRATVRKLGGTIRFESELNVGTVFFVKLPKKLSKGENV